jgi:hypothetical protein
VVNASRILAKTFLCFFIAAALCFRICIRRQTEFEEDRHYLFQHGRWSLTETPSKAWATLQTKVHVDAGCSIVDGTGLGMYLFLSQSFKCCYSSREVTVFEPDPYHPGPLEPFRHLLVPAISQKFSSNLPEGSRRG